MEYEEHLLTKDGVKLSEIRPRFEAAWTLLMFFVKSQYLSHRSLKVQFFEHGNCFSVKDFGFYSTEG